MLPSKATLVLIFLAKVAHADLRTEEREFGEYSYKSLRAIHDQACSCKPDGNCQLKVTREELRRMLLRYTEALPTVVPRLWPELTRKLASMPTADASVYGERLGEDYLNTLPRDVVLLWARMLTSCWSVSADVKKPIAVQLSVGKDIPHDGSLSKRGVVNDLHNGKLDEASGIAVFLQGCRKSAQDNPNAEPFCGCLGDYLRVSSPSVIQVLKDSSNGDVSKLLALPGVKRCIKWIGDGGPANNPYLRDGMMSTIDVELAFLRCQTTVSSKPVSERIVFCNRLVATLRLP